LDEAPPTLPISKLLPVLAGHIPLAIGSSGSRAGIETVLRLLGWTDYFDVLVTGGDVQAGKPAPDIFLLAASQLNVAPKRCLVFEDTDDGMTAAAAAGIEAVDVRRCSAGWLNHA